MIPDKCQWLYPDSEGGTWDELCNSDAVVGVERPVAWGGSGMVLLCEEHRRQVNRPYDERLKDREDQGCQWMLGRTAATKHLCNKPRVKEVKIPLGLGMYGVIELCRIHNAQMNTRNVKRRLDRKAAK